MSHLVQSTLGGRGSATLGGFGILTSSAAGFGQNTVAGNLLVLIVYGSGTAGVGDDGPTIFGGYPQTFFPCLTAARTVGGITGISQIHFISNAPSMSPSQTITYSVSNPGAGSGAFTVAFDLYEFSGVINPQVVEINAGPGVTGRQFFGSAGAVSSAVTATANMDLILVTLIAPTGGALTPGTGYTLGFNGSLVNGQFQYQCGTAIGQTSVGFTGSASVNWSMSAIAFKSDAADSGGGGDGGSGGSGGDTGCGACSGPHLLQLIPGFSDLPDNVLQAEDPAFALHVGEIATNATFGMVRMEVFPCMQIHGDTVALPTSCLDGYKYSRAELNYIWTVQNSTDHSTNWISGPDSLWFANWNVNQVTGEVFSEEWYERSSTADTRLAAKSNDGLLMVFTIAQRQKTNMIMSAPAAYNSISESTIAIDKPYTQDVAQHLNQNAKFGCVNKEFFYLGEYVTGNTVVLPVSEVDGYAYTAAECKFIHTWRWTSLGTNYLQPPGNYEQAAPFQASISAAGVVSIIVTFSTSGGENVVTATNYGRIAAFAFCTRTATPSSGTLAGDFTELSLDYFAPGRTVRASELLTIKRNIDEAILSPEFFGPTDYADAATVPTPVSTVDGYAYARDEVQYIWSWSNVKNNSGGTHVRLPLFLGSVDPDTGKVTLRCWRLPPGGPNVDDSNVNARVSVIVMAIRKSTHPLQAITQKLNANTPSDFSTAPIDTSIIQINGA